ncbi:MAG: hypothetical protein RSB66_03415 [Clostridium sp.]
MKHGLSYLLNMLNISPSKMANHLNVDRSLVSKWKSGARKADVNNDYFHKLIDYILYHNFKLGLRDLETLYSNLYNISYIEDEDHLHKLTKKFIINNDIYSRYDEDTNGTTSSYTIPVEIYTEKENRYICILKLLDFVESQPTPCNLSFIYGDVLDAYMNCKEFRTTLGNRLLELLNKGHKLDISFSKYKHSKFIMSLNQILLHPNYRVFHNHTHLDYKSTIALHSVDNKLVVFSAFNKNNLSSCDYSAVYKDPASITAYSTIINSIKANSKPLFNVLTKTHARNIKYGNRIYLEPNNLFKNTVSTYSHSATPVLFSMSDDLYRRVLINNFDDENEIQKHFQHFKINKEIYYTHIKNNKITIFYPINLWTDLLKGESITYYEQPLIQFAEHKLTRDQFREHLHSLGDFLMEHPNLNICLVGEVYDYNMQHLYLWCTQNQAMCIGNPTQSDNLLICEDMSFVNSIYESLSNFHFLVPSQYKNKETVSHILKSL